MRCVVLGGGGFIGSNLVRRLVADGHSVTAVDVEFPRFRQSALDGAQRFTLDLTNPINARIAVQGAEWVFHLAADMGGVGYFHGPADLGAALTNGLITNNVLTAVLEAQTPRTFYASSACAYPIERQQVAGSAPALHESQIGLGTPDALYGAEKLQGLRLCSKVPGARVGVLHTVYGPLQEHEGRRMKFPAAVATKAITARESGRLELWGDGSQLRSYLFVNDAVERIVRIMEADAYDGPVNVGSAGAVTCLDMARLCLKLCDAEGAEIVTNPAEPSGVLARDCNNSAFEARYGTVDDATHPEGFGRFIDWLDSPATATRTPPRNAMRPPAKVR